MGSTMLTVEGIHFSRALSLWVSVSHSMVELRNEDSNDGY